MHIKAEEMSKREEMPEEKSEKWGVADINSYTLTWTSCTGCLTKKTKGNL